jgi:hypothetical protein
MAATVNVSPNTKKNLESLQVILSSQSGRKFSISDVIDASIEYVRGDPAVFAQLARRAGTKARHRRQRASSSKRA